MEDLDGLDLGFLVNVFFNWLISCSRCRCVFLQRWYRFFDESKVIEEKCVSQIETGNRFSR